MNRTPRRSLTLRPQRTSLHTTADPESDTSLCLSVRSSPVSLAPAKLGGLLPVSFWPSSRAQPLSGEPRRQPGLLPAASHVLALIHTSAGSRSPRCSTALDSSPLTTRRGTCPPSVPVVPAKGATLQEVAKVTAASRVPLPSSTFDSVLLSTQLFGGYLLNAPSVPGDGPALSTQERWLCSCPCRNRRHTASLMLVFLSYPRSSRDVPPPSLCSAFLVGSHCPEGSVHVWPRPLATRTTSLQVEKRGHSTASATMHLP